MALALVGQRLGQFSFCGHVDEAVALSLGVQGLDEDDEEEDGVRRRVEDELDQGAADEHADLWRIKWDAFRRKWHARNKNDEVKYQNTCI